MQIRLLHGRPASLFRDDLLHSGKGNGKHGFVLNVDRPLSMEAPDLYFGKIDWRLMRYCVSEELLNKYFINSRVDLVIKNHHNPLPRPAWNILLGYCLSHPLVGFGTFKSRIDEDWSPR
jgi:hypothetical protein